MEKRVIPVLEMSCAVCAATVEKTVRELAGVEEASVNFSANTLQVVYDPDKISLKDMQAAVSAAGYDLVISENAETDAIDAEHRLYLDLRRRTIGAWSFGLPVMVLSMIFHSPSQILIWILLALTLPVLYWGRSFYVSGWKAVKRGRANMDTLVMLSTAVSFLFSLFSTIYPYFWLSLGLVPHVYYEAVAMIIAFVLSGKLLEARAISETIEENTLGAVMGAYWNGEELCNDGSPRGYAVYEIEGNRIRNWYYKGTAFPREYQMYLYGPGEAVSEKYRDGLILNIFNWHTTWTVEVQEDNAGWVTLPSDSNLRYEMDRRAYDFMLGDTKPEHRPTAEPESQNDHMFYYKPASESWGTVTVRASDPYGNVYTESIRNE